MLIAVPPPDAGTNVTIVGCGTCPPEAPVCRDGACISVCTPACADKECGDDGCGGDCGTCPAAAPMCVANVCNTTCTPQCFGRQCGGDRCGGTCGVCDTNEVCIDGTCARSNGGCPPGAVRCTDGSGYEACGFDRVDTIETTWGPRVACWPGNRCIEAMCTGDCGRPEVVLLVDRSARMAGAPWDLVVDALVRLYTEASALQRVRLAIRAFPAENACAPAALREIAAPIDAAAALTPPGTEASRPTAAALTGLTPWFGAPEQGQAVVVLTGGDDTCASDSTEAARRAGMLHRAGVRVFAIHVANTAPAGGPDAIALAGGTTQAITVFDADELIAALETIGASLGACPTGNATGGPIGSPCEGPEDCASSVCLPSEVSGWPTNSCTQWCTSTCPAGATCTRFDALQSSWCAPTCHDDATCPAHFSCVDGVCLPP